MTNKRLVTIVQKLESKPLDSFLNFAAAQEYQRFEQFDQAEKHYRTILENDPEYIGLYYHFGWLLEQVDRIDEAKEIYLQGMQVSTTLNDLHAKGEIQSSLDRINDEL